MQNLTVIPGHYDGEEWKDDGYTTLIGHRRAAAARAAKIPVVPCAVMRLLTRKEQVAIMLEENMQRTDLTIREQAQGFQMMLDLGDTVEDVAKKTGFSTQTVKHRIEIAKLDPKAIDEAEEDGYYQISIGDYMKLEKLPTIEERNEVLRNVRDGRQLDYKIKDRLQKIEDEKKISQIEEKLKELGVKKGGKNVNQWSSEWDTEKDISLDKETKIGAIKDPEECVWVLGYRCVRVLRKAKRKKNTELSEYQKQGKYNDMRRKKCRQIQKDMDARRQAFIRRIANHEVMPAPADHERDIINLLLAIALDGSAWLSAEMLMEYYTGKERWNLSEDAKKEATEALARMAVIPKLIMAVDGYFRMRTGTDEELLITYRGPKNEERLKLMNTFYHMILEREYGYVPDEEEKLILQGKHEVFKTYEEAKAEGKA